MREMTFNGRKSAEEITIVPNVGFTEGKRHAAVLPTTAAGRETHPLFATRIYTTEALFPDHDSDTTFPFLYLVAFFFVVTFSCQGTIKMSWIHDSQSRQGSVMHHRQLHVWVITPFMAVVFSEKLELGLKTGTFLVSSLIRSCGNSSEDLKAGNTFWVKSGNQDQNAFHIRPISYDTSPFLNIPVSEKKSRRKISCFLPNRNKNTDSENEVLFEKPWRRLRREKSQSQAAQCRLWLSGWVRRFSPASCSFIRWIMHELQ